MDFISHIFNAGVVGCGGAGFPTHVKLKSSPEYFIVNGAECLAAASDRPIYYDRTFR